MAFFKRAWPMIKVVSRPWASFLLLKQTFFWSLNFDVSSFWNQWEFRDVIYLIWKVWSVPSWSQKLKGVAVHLPCVMPIWKRPFYTIQRLGCHLIWIQLYTYDRYLCCFLLDFLIFFAREITRASCLVLTTIFDLILLHHRVPKWI